jgi:hypothetical protein
MDPPKKATAIAFFIATPAPCRRRGIICRWGDDFGVLVAGNFLEEADWSARRAGFGFQEVPGRGE